MDLHDVKSIFNQMLSKCKITKLWDVNFKILSRILATPIVIAATKKKENLQWCSWYGARASISHILVSCPQTTALHDYIDSISVMPCLDMSMH